MSILAKDAGGQTYELCPTGQFPAVLVDVIDLGEKETPFLHEKGPKQGQKKWSHQVKLIWQIAAEEEDEDGEWVASTRDDGLMHRVGKYYTLSLNEKANLRKDLDTWRGKAFTDDELSQGFDLEKLIGIQCRLVVGRRKTKAGDERVDIQAVLPKDRRDPAIEPDEYQREMHRPGGFDVRSPKQAEGGAAPQREEEEEEPDLPF